MPTRTWASKTDRKTSPSKNSSRNLETKLSANPFCQGYTAPNEKWAIVKTSGTFVFRSQTWDKQRKRTLNAGRPSGGLPWSWSFLRGDTSSQEAARKHGLTVAEIE